MFFSFKISCDKTWLPSAFEILIIAFHIIYLFLLKYIILDFLCRIPRKTTFLTNIPLKWLKLEGISFQKI